MNAASQKALCDWAVAESECRNEGALAQEWFHANKMIHALAEALLNEHEQLLERVEPRTSPSAPEGGAKEQSAPVDALQFPLTRPNLDIPADVRREIESYGEENE